METDNRRRGYRTDLDIIDLPFLGRRKGDLTPFEYQLLDVSAAGLRVRIKDNQKPQGTPLKEGDTIDLLVMLRPRSEEDFLFDYGRIMWINSDDTEGGTICGLRIEEGHDALTETDSPACALSLCLETSDVSFRDMDGGSADTMLADIIEESVSIRRSILDEVDAFRAGPTGAGDGDGNPGPADDLFAAFRAKEEGEISRLVSCSGAIREGVGPECAEGDVIAYDDLCLLLRADTAGANWGLMAPPGADRPEMARIDSLLRRLYVNHNQVVLLKFGYLAYMYQNPEDLY